MMPSEQSSKKFVAKVCSYARVKSMQFVTRVGYHVGVDNKDIFMRMEIPLKQI